MKRLQAPGALMLWGLPSGLPGLLICRLTPPLLPCFITCLAGGGDVGWTLGAALAEGYRLAGLGQGKGGMQLR